MAEVKNPGWAGETGEFGHLTEADVRGTVYVGERPPEGGHPGGACSYPYQLADRDPEAPLFEGPYRERLEKILSRYPNKQAALLPALNLAQEIRGWLAPDAMEAVARELDLAPAYVRGVATFYTMYNKRPVGRVLIQVCTNVACNLCGADEVFEAFLQETGTEAGELSDDGLFTVIEAECLGACGFPTVVQINERYFENVEPEDVPAILTRLREEQKVGARAGARARAREGSPSSEGDPHRTQHAPANPSPSPSPSPSPGEGKGEGEEG
ncbi:MAG TPA: NAD(P)H-dependent oxidoreductase subunit E [Longimicrobiales bacterium]